MSKHTPAPWTVGNAGRNACIVYTDDAAVAVCQVFGLPMNRSIGELEPINEWQIGLADARLISAAPDMAEALRRLCHYANDVREDGGPPSHEDWRNAWEAARAALKKAGIQ